MYTKGSNKECCIVDIKKTDCCNGEIKEVEVSQSASCCSVTEIEQENTCC
ncbi:hypothetical protein PY093_08975 [Cytobacillus sp. S13-E01]|nr:hypothetical protein [Cytobacillus sp. S13-E01]MDF0726846.1 hypothetical protein [Cytobacillus sp. S13-E01]